MLPHVLGDANLKVNVSVELTGETFHTDLTTVVSELFNNKSHWIEAQVCTRVSHLLPINRLKKFTKTIKTNFISTERCQVKNNFTKSLLKVRICIQSLD